ncbi:hypothetical protein RRG08_020621 [Elysia crispata]|uniref:Uncharacterized protein n=1 Tax=Elysia crispata TaxID=231223 RepID=A0AAE0YPR0_9GAST|nr:hypothetical protein RRG08_020621 [Elysia crispata]
MQRQSRSKPRRSPMLQISHLTSIYKRLNCRGETLSNGVCTSEGDNYHFSIDSSEGHTACSGSILQNSEQGTALWSSC